MLNNKLSWDDHLFGNNRLINELRKRLFLLRKIKNRIPYNELFQVAKSTFVSKLAYGLVLFGSVKFANLDPSKSYMKKLQIIQNKMLRTISSKFMKTEDFGTKKLCMHYDILSINQMTAYFTVLEFWKVINNKYNPLKYLVKELSDSQEIYHSTRFKEDGKIQPIYKNHNKPTFLSQGIKLWNLIGNDFREARKYSTAKRIAYKFSKTLPLQ